MSPEELPLAPKEPAGADDDQPGRVATVAGRPDGLGPAAYCWYCYQPNPHPTGECTTCGQRIEPPAGTTATDIELWALSHPDADRRRQAVHQLGARHEPRAARPLHGLVTSDHTDPELAVAAMYALVDICGRDASTATLDHLAATGPGPVRAAAFHLLST